MPAFNIDELVPPTLVALFEPPDGGQFAGMREQGQLIDGVLKVGATTQLRVHKVIVCGHSPYLRQMFTAGLAESAGGTTVTKVELFDVGDKPVGVLLDSMYSGRLALTPGTVCGVLKTANMFQMGAAEQAAINFLVENLEPATASAALSFAEQMSVGGSGGRDLRARVLDYVLEHFTCVAAETSFVQMPLQELAELLGSDKLKIEDEGVALSAALDWVKHDTESRHAALLRLLPLVRFPLLDSVPSRLVEESELLHKSAAVTKLALQCMCECSAAFRGSPDATDCPRLNMRHAQQKALLHSTVGVQLNFTAGDGWQTIHDVPYSDDTDDDALEQRCKDFKLLLVGARRAEDTAFTLCAIAPPAVVFRKTTGNDTHEHQGVHWYRSANDWYDSDDDDKQAMGFAASAEIDCSAADTTNIYGSDAEGKADGERRLSWHLGANGGGWRAGLATDLDNDTEWHKVILAR